MIISVSAAIYHQTGQAGVNPIVFTYGEDTLQCGGSISPNSVKAVFTRIPLAVESDIVITQLINLTNVDSSDHSVKVSVSAEDFGSELSSLRLYLVSRSGTKTLVVELDDSGNVVKENVSVIIPREEEWTIKLEGHYDSGTLSSQSNTMALTFQAT